MIYETYERHYKYLKDQPKKFLVESKLYLFLRSKRELNKYLKPDGQFLAEQSNAAYKAFAPYELDAAVHPS